MLPRTLTCHPTNRRRADGGRIDYPRRFLAGAGFCDAEGALGDTTTSPSGMDGFTHPSSPYGPGSGHVFIQTNGTRGCRFLLLVKLMKPCRVILERSLRICINAGNRTSR